MTATQSRSPIDAENATNPAERQLTTQVLRSVEEIEAVREEWESFLTERAADHDFLQHPEMITHDFREHERSYEPMVIIVRHQGQIQATAPWYIHRLRFPIKMGVKNIARVPVRLCKLSGADMALARDVPAREMLDVIFTAVHHERSRFDLVGLFDMDVPGYLWNYLESVKDQDRRFRNTTINAEPLDHLQIVLPDSFDDFMASLSSKKRNNLRKHERDLKKASNDSIELVPITAPDQIEDFFESVRQVYAASWQGNTMGGDRGSDLQVRYNKKVASHGWVRFHLLKSDAGPICYSLGYQYGGVFYCQDMAYDPAWRKCAPGNYMFVNIIKELYEHDTPKLIDFGAGDSVFKRQFSNKSGTSQTVYLLPSGRMYGAGVIHTQRITHNMYVRIRSLLQRFGVDRWVREKVKRRSS